MKEEVGPFFFPPLQTTTNTSTRLIARKQEKQTRDKHKHNKRTTENTTGVLRTIGVKILKS